MQAEAITGLSFQVAEVAEQSKDSTVGATAAPSNEVKLKHMQERLAAWQAQHDQGEKQCD
jgi:hypothetical protein